MRNLVLVLVGLLSVTACGAEPVRAPEPPVLVFPDASPLKRRHRNHSMTESPDGQLRVYVAQEGDVSDLMAMHRQPDGGWSAPERIDLPKRELNVSPRFDPRTGDMYYSSDAPHPERRARRDLNIWVVSPEGDGWGVPRVLPDSINSGSFEDGFAIGGDGTAIFSSTTLGGTGGYDLYIARPITGPIEDWLVEPFPYNTQLADSQPVLSADGNLLIWYAHLPKEAVIGVVDLFYSRRVDGAWTPPKNMGPWVNSDGIDYGAGLSADGETLFFYRDGRLYQTALGPLLRAAETD